MEREEYSLGNGIETGQRRSEMKYPVALVPRENNVTRFGVL